MRRGWLASLTDPTAEESPVAGVEPAQRTGAQRRLEGGSLPLTDRPLVPRPSMALGPRGAQHKRDFLGALSLAIFTLWFAGPASGTEPHTTKWATWKGCLYLSTPTTEPLLLEGTFSKRQGCGDDRTEDHKAS